MQKVLAIFSISLIVCGCSSKSILPGMSGINHAIIPKYAVPESITVKPILIPITVSLLINQPPPLYIYHIAPQDVLSISIWRHPEFNAPIQTTAVSGTQSTQGAGQTGYLVNEKGEIFFPLVGNVSVAGKTIEQTRIELTKRLRTYIRHPQVSVRVADYRSKKVYVLGEVVKPMLLPLNDQSMSITDALTLVGSFDSATADTRHIYVIRGDFTRPTIYWLDARTPDVLLLAEHFHLQPGDILYVSSALMTDWNRVLNNFLPTIQAVWFTRSLVDTGK